MTERTTERRTDTRGGKESTKRDRRGRRVRLQFVLGSHSAFLHPAIRGFDWTTEGQVVEGKG